MSHQSKPTKIFAFVPEAAVSLLHAPQGWRAADCLFFPPFLPTPPPKSQGGKVWVAGDASAAYFRGAILLLQ